MCRDDLAAGHALRWFNITTEWMATPRAISTAASPLKKRTVAKRRKATCDNSGDLTWVADWSFITPSHPPRGLRQKAATVANLILFCYRTSYLGEVGYILCPRENTWGSGIFSVAPLIATDIARGKGRWFPHQPSQACWLNCTRQPFLIPPIIWPTLKASRGTFDDRLHHGGI